MKKIFVLTLTALLLISFAAVAYASGLYISSASNSISKSGTYVTMGQTTYTNQTATKIKHVKTLQKNVGGSWTTIASVTTYSYGTAYFHDSSGRTVDSGYSYRVVTYHYAYEGTALVDTEVRTSGSIYVN